MIDPPSLQFIVGSMIEFKNIGIYFWYWRVYVNLDQHFRSSENIIKTILLLIATSEILFTYHELEDGDSDVLLILEDGDSDVLLTLEDGDSDNN